MRRVGCLSRRSFDAGSGGHVFRRKSGSVRCHRVPAEAPKLPSGYLEYGPIHAGRLAAAVYLISSYVGRYPSIGHVQESKAPGEIGTHLAHGPVVEF